MKIENIPVHLPEETSGGVERLARPEIVLAGPGRSVIWEAVQRTCDGARIGTWFGEAGRLAVQSYPNDEVFCVTAGHIRLTGKHDPIDIMPGQGAFVPKGWSGVWENIEASRKVFVILTSTDVLEEKD